MKKNSIVKFIIGFDIILLNYTDNTLQHDEIHVSNFTEFIILVIS